MASIELVKNFFGLIKMPFSKAIGVNELFQGQSFKEATSRLQIALENEDVALLTGPVGSGKTNVLRYFANQLDPQAYKAIYIAADEFSLGEIAKRALAALQVQVPFQSSPAIRTLQQTISQLNHEKNIQPVLIIDEIQELPVATLASLKSLLNYHMDSENLLFLLLCGQNTIIENLALIRLEALERRIRVRHALRALSLEETASYITHQMNTCGVKQAVFTDDTKAGIFHHSKGIISTINALCFQLLIYAAAQSKQIIEPSMLELILSQTHIS